MNSNRRLGFTYFAALLLSSVVSVTAAAQDLSTLGNRTFLCIKRVGKTADGSKNRGRDAFMNPGSCPKGYFAIDLLGLVGSKSVTGPQGPQGPIGPQGVPGPVSGTIFGRIISCEQDLESQSVSTPCDVRPENQEGQKGGDGYEVYIPGNSFLSRPDKSCMFRLTNVPAGTYDLVLGKIGKGKFVKSIKGVVAADGTSTSVGDISVCRDLDDDGYDTTNDCDDSNVEINPAATEVCNDESDNNCNGVIDEGCSQSSSSSSSSSSQP